MIYTTLLRHVSRVIFCVFWRPESCLERDCKLQIDTNTFRTCNQKLYLHLLWQKIYRKSQVYASRNILPILWVFSTRTIQSGGVHVISLYFGGPWVKVSIKRQASFKYKTCIHSRLHRQMCCKTNSLQSSKWLTRWTTLRDIVIIKSFVSDLQHRRKVWLICDSFLGSFKGEYHSYMILDVDPTHLVGRGRINHSECSIIQLQYTDQKAKTRSKSLPRKIFVMYFFSLYGDSNWHNLSTECSQGKSCLLSPTAGKFKAWNFWK